MRRDASDWHLAGKYDISYFLPNTTKYHTQKYDISYLIPLQSPRLKGLPLSPGFLNPPLQR